MADPIPTPADPPVEPPTDQTNPGDAGHTTSEYFWHKVFMILASVVSATAFVGDALLQVTKVIPEGSKFLQWAAVVGGVAALVGKISYEISRTLVKLKLVDGQIEAAKAATRTPEDAARTVLGQGG